VFVLDRPFKISLDLQVRPEVYPKVEHLKYASLG
jgi:hypothetical protein